jgi:hypothetical protein
LCSHHAGMCNAYSNRELAWHPAWERLSAAPPDLYKSNGATNAPDRIGVVDLRAAAHRHDYRYEKGGTEWDRYVADMLFLYDAIQCCLAFGAGTRLARAYFYRVRLWGYRYFQYKTGHGPQNRRERIWLWFRLLRGRYIEW